MKYWAGMESVFSSRRSNVEIVIDLAYCLRIAKKGGDLPQVNANSLNSKKSPKSKELYLMRQTSILLIALAMVVTAYRLFVPIAYEKGHGISPVEFQCSKEMVHLTIDNLIQRIPLTKIHIGRSASGGTIATAYFLIFPYVKISINKGCDSAVRLR